MAAPQFSIRTVDDAGKLDQFLPDFQTLDVSPVFGQAGTVSIKYPENGINFDLLMEDTELAILIDGVEAGGLRCIVEQPEGDNANEASDGMVWTFTCRTTLCLFDRAVVYPENWPTANPPHHNFFGTNPGKMFQDLFNAAQARGALQGITLGFNAATDSAGQPWGISLQSVTYDAGTKYSDILQNFVDSGYADVKMEKRTLYLYSPGTLGVDRTTGTNPLRFHRGRDMKESPRKISTRDMNTTMLVAGMNNVYTEVTSDSPTMSQWGRREGYFSANSTDIIPTLNYLGGLKLDTVNRPVLEVTHGLYFDNEAVNPRPIRNFDIGDWSLSDVGNGWEKYRIKQWVLSVDNNGEVSGSVTLNDLFAEHIEKINIRLGALENGTSNAGASEEKDDGKPPASPQGVTVNTDYYLDHNQSRAFITVIWEPVTTNSDGTAATDLSYYLVRWRYVGASDWQLTTRVDSDTVTAYFAGIFTNTQVEVGVQAVDKYNHASTWSPSAVVTTARDTVAPNKPSAPTVTSNVGTLRVIWNGLDYLGAAMPADFAGVEVHIGTDGAFTPSSSTLKDYLPSAAATATTITGLAYGTEWFARLVAVDTSGNKSPASDLTSTSHAILSQVVSTEIGSGQVGLNNTAFSDVGNLIDDGNFEIASYRTSRQSLITGYHLSFDSSTSSVGGWSLRSDSFSAGSLEYFTIQDSLPVKPGERIFGALDMRATSDANGTANLDIAWFNGAGAQIDSSGNPSGAFATLSGMGFTAKDNTWHSRVTGNSQVAPPNVASMKLILFTNGRSAGTVWFDAIEVRRQVDTLLVADAAITTAKIADLAVNDAKIASASIGKLTAGTLNADMSVAARIKTSNTGARVELNTSGIQVFNSGGTQTAAISSADGSIDITGTLRSGTTGTRIEINPSGLPTIRLYSGAGTEFGFVNGFTLSGTDVGVGMTSSNFSGNSTQLNSRVVAYASQGSLEVVRADTQQNSGGYVWVLPSQATVGYSISGGQGAYLTASAHDFFATADGGNNGYIELGSNFAKMGIKAGTSSENTMYFDPTFTRHYGRWENSGASTGTQGLVQGRVDIASGFSGITISYGPTMNSAMEPMVSLGASSFGTTTTLSWGVNAGTGSTTSFSVGYSNAVAVSIVYRCFRI